MRTIKPLEMTHFYVLLALAEGPQHGYAIHEQVCADSHNAVYFTYPALYNLLHVLERKRYIQTTERAELGATSQGPARVYYALTLGGRRLLKATASQLWDAGRLARERIA